MVIICQTQILKKASQGLKPGLNGPLLVLFKTYDRFNFNQTWPKWPTKDSLGQVRLKLNLSYVLKRTNKGPFRPGLVKIGPVRPLKEDQQRTILTRFG
jgi:hypothetical protein